MNHDHIKSLSFMGNDAVAFGKTIEIAVFQKELVDKVIAEALAEIKKGSYDEALISAPEKKVVRLFWSNNQVFMSQIVMDLAKLN